MFGILFIIIILPIILILLVVGIVTKKKIFIKAPIYFIIFLVFIATISWIINRYNEKITLKHKDYFGYYQIDTSFYPGKQAKWQFENLKLKLTANNQLLLYDKNSRNKIIKGKFTTVTPYNSARLVIISTNQSHHLLKENPTTYRSNSSFYLVFHSDKFKNVFFRKIK
jgi:type IV secretory pathway TrbL component